MSQKGFVDIMYIQCTDIVWTNHVKLMRFGSLMHANAGQYFMKMPLIAVMKPLKINILSGGER